MYILPRCCFFRGLFLCKTSNKKLGATAYQRLLGDPSPPWTQALECRPEPRGGRRWPSAVVCHNPTIEHQYQVLNRAEVVSFLSFPLSVVPSFRHSRILSFLSSFVSTFCRPIFFVKIKKNSFKNGFPTLFYGYHVPQNKCNFSKKIHHSSLRPPKKIFCPCRQKKFEFFCQIQKIPAYLNSPTSK